MGEQAPRYYPVRQENLDAFYRSPGLAEKRQEFIDRGITPTNNLSLYFKDQPAREIMAGTDIPNPFDYNRFSFGPAICWLRDTHSDVWEEGKEVIAYNVEKLGRYADLMFSGKREEADAMREEVDEAFWRQAEVMSRAFNLMLPELEAAGVDPLDVCR